MPAFERFLEYVKINTQSDENTKTHPSFSGEFDLAKRLVSELKGMGVEASVDEKCYVMAKIAATEGYEERPVIGFISHMDTAPACSGENVHPVIHENYDGSDVCYPCGKIMKVSDFPDLLKMKGETLITSDGTTLLGADDKSGVAEIMTAIEEVINKNIPHGPVAVAFTPDEEIGEGADNFDVKKFGADFAYTVDGGDVNTIEYENFNAADANIKITGLSVHPGTAKNVMINAVNLAHEFHAMIPRDERPETTEGYEGFYHLTGITGDCETAELHYIIRDHDRQKFEEKKEFIKSCADRINSVYGENTLELTVKDSYYNMKEKILPHMHLIETAKKAVAAAGLECEEVPIRGGTDGARLSYMGLPAPNLGTGGFNFHGPFEFITAERMDRAVSVIVNIIEEYAGSVVE